MNLLEVCGLAVSYGRRSVLRDLSFGVSAGGIVAVLGANGAGKSTMLRTISGLVRPLAGAITFDGEDLVRLSPGEIVARGVCQVPEGRRIFSRLSVLENLQLGAYLRPGGPETGKVLDRVLSMFPVLAERRRQAAGTLSGGEQQMLAIGRALMGRPRLLLLDEPSLGLAPRLVTRIFSIIGEIHAAGCAIVLVEQNARRALLLAQQGFVLEGGTISIRGPARELMEDARVREAYLGG
ncbi:MAG: ABC transporter ATP-binding protein [bacterium]